MEEIEGVTPMYLIPTQWVACHKCNWAGNWPEHLGDSLWVERRGEGLRLFVSEDGAYEFEQQSQVWLGPKGIGRLRKFLG